ncbi:acyl-CoA carboxylase subunit epsilon [Streptomyces sp. NPDC056401]|uniref:acyl-CoA carboxylase subunit epsilon n=1 Tax=Streptomyces sp. NPDC056401 TaxID=3345809 RepID=UPI0035DF27C7
MSNATATLLKVEKGNAEPEELAAITAILLARAAAPEDTATAAASSQAGWRRLERTPGFRGPRSWQG